MDSTFVYFVLWSFFLLGLGHLLLALNPSVANDSMIWKLLLCCSFLPLVPWPEFSVAALNNRFFLPQEWLMHLPQTTNVERVLTNHVNATVGYDLLQLTMAFIFLISALRLLVLSKRIFQFNRSLNHWKNLSLDAEPLFFLQLEQRQFLMKNKVSILQSDEAISPMVLGLLRPKLILPSHMFQLPIEQQTLLIEHEINHLKRRDLFWLFSTHLLQTAFWFMPFYRFVNKKLTLAIEVECDQQVLEVYPTKSKSYGQALINVARQTRTAFVPQVAAINHGQLDELKQRLLITQNINKQEGNNTMKRFSYLLSSTALVLLSWTLNAKDVKSITVDDFKHLHVHATKNMKDNVEVEKIDGLWLNPVKTAKVSSSFKAKERFRKSKPHLGIDLAAAQGDEIVAASSGVVIIADNSTLHKNYGNVVIIDHGEGVVTLYAHMENIAVQVGDVVGAGHFIGTVGSTGRSTGPHLHFEVLAEKSHVDPASLIDFH